MEETQKACQLSQKEISQIDIKQIAFYTLKDGTILQIKQEKENTNEEQLNNNQQLPEENQQENQQENLEQIQETQNNQINEQEQNLESNEYQEQVQIESQNQYQEQGEEQIQVREQEEEQEQKILNQGEENVNSPINTDINYNIQNTQDIPILEPGENYGLYISGENNQPQPQLNNFTCTCRNQAQIPNARLINVQKAVNQTNQYYNNYSEQYGTQSYQQGPIYRKQFYKLVTAIPFRSNNLKGFQLISPMGSRVITLQNNTMSQIVGNQYINQNQYSGEQFQEQEYQYDDNQENIEYCNCELQYSSEPSKIKEKNVGIEPKCICGYDERNKK